MEYRNQHFIPQFLLKKWTGDNGLLYRFRYVYRKFEVTSKSPVQVGYQEKYLNFHYRKDLPKHFIESTVNKKYDDEGAKVLDELLTVDLRNLTTSQEEQWFALIASLLIRNPLIVNTRLRNKGTSFTALLNENIDEYELLRNDGDPQTASEYVEKLKPGFIEDIGLSLIPNVVDLIASRLMNEMEWCVVNTTLDAPTLLIGDNPVIITAETTDPNCIVALPISPRHVFLASRPSVQWNRLMNISHKMLVKAVNFETVTRAKYEVYSLNKIQTPFIKKHLRNNLF